MNAVSSSALAIVKGLVISLLMTLGIELCVAAVFLHLSERTAGKKRYGMEYLIVSLVNVLTNPLVVGLVYTVMLLRPALRWPVEILLEILVIPAEGLLYRAAKKSGFDFRKPFLLALCCNLSSYGIGLLVNFFRAL